MVILVDRGFDIQGSIRIFCAAVEALTFTKGKKQFEGIEVEQMRCI